MSVRLMFVLSIVAAGSFARADPIPSVDETVILSEAAEVADRRFSAGEDADLPAYLTDSVNSEVDETLTVMVEADAAL
ncbi:MAG: hypothetical protein AAF674_02670 [Pseudomonadota bacterium]